MKTKITALLLLLALAFCLVSCGGESDPWESATYTEDAEFGTGTKTVEVEVKVGEHSVTFTLKTDKENLADALLEHNLISGEDSTYGLYVKTVNGILADFDKDQSWWGVYKNGEATLGASSTEIKDGEHYELVYSK